MFGLFHEIHFSISMEINFVEVDCIESTIKKIINETFDLKCKQFAIALFIELKSKIFESKQ